METRKCPHFLEGIDSLVFTDSDDKMVGKKFKSRYIKLESV